MAGIAGQVHVNRQEPIYRTRIWRGMRALRVFSLEDLEMLSQTSYANVRKFTKSLELSGFVRIIKDREPGRKGSLQLYQLVRNSGPRCPIPRFRQAVVYDPNTETSYEVEQVEQGVSLRQLAWDLICRSKTFTIPQLMEVGISESNAQKYVLGLERGGIIQKIETLKSSEQGGRAWSVYELAKPCGSVAPRVLRNGLGVVEGKRNA